VKIKLWLISLIGFLLLNLTGVGHALIINIDATNSINAINYKLDEGYYEVKPIIGDFTAWNAWGWVNGEENDYPHSSADRSTLGVGWLNTYYINDISYGDGMLYYDPHDALDNAISAFFALTTSETVKFSINDIYFRDNIGGMSLDVRKINSPVPEPSTMLLFCFGLLCFFGTARRSFNN
jgi:hypothetical protein